jgi:hypothetical protein
LGCFVWVRLRCGSPGGGVSGLMGGWGGDDAKCVWGASVFLETGGETEAEAVVVGGCVGAGEEEEEKTLNVGGPRERFVAMRMVVVGANTGVGRAWCLLLAAVAAAAAVVVGVPAARAGDGSRAACAGRGTSIAPRRFVVRGGAVSLGPGDRFEVGQRVRAGRGMCCARFLF